MEKEGAGWSQGCDVLRERVWILEGRRKSQGRREEKGLESSGLGVGVRGRGSATGWCHGEGV